MENKWLTGVSTDRSHVSARCNNSGIHYLYTCHMAIGHKIDIMVLLASQVDTS